MAPMLFALSLMLIPPQGTKDVSTLFKTFRSSSDASYPLRKPSEPIKIYATDDSNTKLCYISNNIIYIYSNGRITRPLFAKVFNIKAVNRITYYKSNSGGSFQFWIDDELALSIAS